MSKEDEGAKQNPVLTVLDESTNDKYSRATGRKGVGQDHEMDWLIEDVSDELKVRGHQGGVGGQIIMKADDETNIIALRNALMKHHGGVVVPEQPAKNESQSNGAVEEGCRIVSGFTRVLKEQLGDKAKMKLETDSPMIQWMIRWAAMMTSRYLVGTDGRTSYERRKGRRCDLEVVPCGEAVWYKNVREGKERKDKLESEWEEGVARTRQAIK